MKTIIRSLTKLLRHPRAKSQPPKTNRPKRTANCEQPIAKGQKPTTKCEQLKANGQKPTADPTVLLNLFLTLSSD